VSPLLHDELRVVLYPDRVVLVRTERALTHRGVRRRISAESTVLCNALAGSDTPWDAAMKVLDTELSLVSRKAFAMVILSNHFMRYALLPWSEALTDEAEELAFAKHFFKQTYGAAADHWELRLNPGRIGVPQLASAVDGRLLEDLSAVFVRASIKIRSIQPHLMAAYNNCLTSLQNRSAWFVLVEPGCLCLVLLQKGHWTNVRTMRIGSDWRNVLPPLLEREACMVDSDNMTETILLLAPKLGKAALPPMGRWKVENLQSAMRADVVPEFEGLTTVPSE
jgi:hypothetical protein